MTSLGEQFGTSTGLAKRLASRGDLSGFLMALCQAIGADSYMLVAVVNDQNRSDVRIVASNWIYDTIQLVGHETVAAIAQCAHAAAPGARPRPITTREAPALAGVLGGEEARLLDVLGHGEIYALRLNVGRQRLFMLLSTEEPGQLDPAELARAQIRCCHALSQVPDLLAATTQQDPLSDRERECLYWVSEGKTTDEVALILGVSSNTVNSYVTHAIQKFSASNRVMAVATAIRSGIF
ncbi:LuxR C-terminal-related transcriptional regulator [Mesorhizobium sp. LHD-90]|uniref:helix-turn-helix transcriptional regulator n=1 Tax=Mesorhizobium sp. LHD-90 TaxID=3071414 RepID=UPI0027E02AE5|nr:LuxR C-terminal-related transcriptional regulator [Mesorhizobium sp. LHD-90]MDQ6433753.1 LuxR C-terminal-related transcriptional regulator [Mesorhizobium sp. LHD-90]